MTVSEWEFELTSAILSGIPFVGESLPFLQTNWVYGRRVPVSGREAELNEASSIGFSGGGESLLSVLQFKVLYRRLATVVSKYRFL